VAAAARWRRPAWQGRRQLCGSKILAVAAAHLEMRRQCDGGGGNNGALAVAAWRVLIIVLILTMMMMIDYILFLCCGGGGKGEGGGERAGCMCCWRLSRWTAMTIAMVIV
jgi:hypothetical protein